MLKRELKINLKSLIIWTVILLAMYILIFSIYPSLINEETKESLTQMMNSMPKEILSNFNMDIVGIESAYGWFKTEGYTFLTLLGGVYAAILGSTILAKEENDKTIEFLISKPISRSSVVTSKILCGIINIVIFTGVITLGNFIALKISGELDVKQYLMISILPILLYFMLFFITLFLSTFFKKAKKSMSLGIAIVFISYFMQIIGGMGENVEIIKNISLFEFVSSRYIILNNSIDWKYVVIGAVIIFISVLATYKRYHDKEFS